MGKRYAITTKDNPFNPFTEFDKWFLYDIEKGYYTCSYLGRIAQTSDLFTDYENNSEIERAIDEIIKHDFRKIFVKVSIEDENDETNNEQLLN